MAAVSAQPVDAVMDAVSTTENGVGGMPSTSNAVDIPAAATASEVPEVRPVETLYLNNLNEKITTKIMKQTLRNLFRQYGVVLDVVAHRNLRMRGQAFIAMTDRAAAARAVKEVRGFPLYGKPINVAFARTPSDAVVKRKTPDLIDVHLQERKDRKRACPIIFDRPWLIFPEQCRHLAKAQSTTSESCCREVRSQVW